MAFTVTVLGSSGGYAAPGNACSGYLVVADGFRLLMDCGPGTLANLQEHIALTELDAVLCTHSHPDHWLELPVMRSALRYVLHHVGVPVYLTAETRAQALALCGGAEDPTFVWHTITGGEDRSIGPLRVRTSRTDHPPETLAVRLDLGDRSLGYTADTGPGWSIAELGAGLTTGLSEATVLDADRDQVAGMHLTAAEAGAAARRAGVERLVITHQTPGSDLERFRAEAADAYGAPVLVATPGATFQP
jgi:ribonuclease BN (tRNA processing enzyme)